MQEIRRKYFGERKKGHSPRPGNIRPANRPPIGRPIRPLTTNRPDFRPRFPDSLFPCFPVRFPGSGPDLVLEKIPEPQTVRPIDNPADRPSHKQTAPQTAPAARRRPGTKKRRPHSFLCGHPVIGYGGASSPRPLFSGDYSSSSFLAAAFLADLASAASMALFRAASPAMSPSVVFSTEALIFFTVDFVATAAARFSAYSAANSARFASSYVRRCERVMRLVAFENSRILKLSLSPVFGVVPSSLTS